MLIGDFNAHRRQWVNSVSPTVCHGVAALDYESHTLVQRKEQHIIFGVKPYENCLGEMILNLEQTHSVYDAAEKDYIENVKETPSGVLYQHKWWPTLITVLFGIDVFTPVLKPDG
ncbi:hypothetical protein SK128_009206, partial [Halocaridina rubra]